MFRENLAPIGGDTRGLAEHERVAISGADDLVSSTVNDWDRVA